MCMIPLAWMNLTHNRVRMALFGAGIGFAVVLMFIQFGFRNALLDASVLMHEKLRADLVLASRQQNTVILRATFPREVVMRIRSVPGVAEAHPLYLEYSRSILRHTAQREEDRLPNKDIRVIGVDPDAYLLDFPALKP